MDEQQTIGYSSTGDIAQLGSTLTTNTVFYDPQWLGSELKLREITITPLNKGYLVRVGCQQFAIGGTKKLIAKLTKYLENPKDVENIWMNEHII